MKKIRRVRLRRQEQIGVCAEWLFHYEEVATGEKWTLGPYKNTVVQGGLDNMAALLIGENPSTTAAMHCVIGSNATAAATTDTLTAMTEVARGDVTSKTRSGAIARLRAFFGTSEANGNHQCVGLVARSTDTAGSGVLLNRLVQAFSKTASTILTIEVRWTFAGV